MAITPHFATVRRRIRLRGIVQGVGFRPFVYNLAKRIGIRGFILNSSSGVTIEAEGSEAALEEFQKAVRTEHPTLARIEEMSTTELLPFGDTGFEIRESLSVEGDFVLVSPDVTACQDCLLDIGDTANRRFGYPFTNCTNCGPRYSIIQNIPYDRPNTTMAGFRMCADCEAEYNDPSDRRFHAQPNACPACGPTVVLAQSGTSFPDLGAFKSGDISTTLKEVRRLLHSGSILAIKALGGFQLACDAASDAAVQRGRIDSAR